MIFKPIVPGMVIHCITEDEANALLNYLAELGYKWIGGAKLTDHNNFSDYGGTCYVVRTFVVDYGNKDFYEQRGYKITEFSDLVLPELTAEEVVPILTEICNKYNKNEDCEGCPLNGLEHICNGNECPFTFKDYKQVIKICQQWKSDHEKKEPEIETVDICRIIEIQPDGRKRCVHEEDMNNPDRTIGEKSYLLDVEEILRCYCMEHDGEFIAVHEVVSRVKAVN